MSNQVAEHETAGMAFGRLPSLTHQLKELIHDYPEGIGIIKELLQNADDATARTLHVMADWRRHAAESVPAPAMAAFQGPALLFRNDKVFSDDDFDRIQEIYQSGKIRAAEKTGQFGKGFNTVYNVTDWPSFVTRDRIAIFDPHTRTVPNATSTCPGRTWSLATCWKIYPDLVRPFTAAGLQLGQTEYPGTIFRLPMRTPEQARVSEISHRAFGTANWNELVEQLCNVREELLLFLKHLEDLQVSEIPANGGERRDLLCVRTTNSGEVRAERERVLAVLRGDTAGLVGRLAGCNPLRIPYVHHFSSRWLLAHDESSTYAEDSSSWRIVACLALDASGEIAEAMEELRQREVKAVPLGGAAARLSHSGEEARSTSRVNGRAYCSLPLPVETGFPVHVNGFFDLDSSRHALTTDSGQTGAARIRVRWNQLLVRHVISQAYAQLVYNVSRDIGEKKPVAYYALWPEARRTTPKPFVDLATEVYKIMANWTVIRATGAERWLSIGQIVHLPKNWEDLSEPLVAQGLALPDPAVKAAIIVGFTKAGLALDEFNPSNLRQLLRQSAPLAVRPKDAPLPCLRKRAWLEVLLKFCISDGPRDLTSLPLALMSDGVLRTFTHSEQVPIYIANSQERAIFHGQPGWFVNEPYALATGLSTTPRTGAVWMTATETVKRLQLLLPKAGTHRLQPDLSRTEFLHAGWLKLVYDYFVGAVRGGFEPDDNDFRAIALVPDQNGTLHAPAFASTPLLIQDFSTESLHAALRAFTISIASAVKPLEETMRTFDSICGFCFVPKVTGPQLAFTLAILPRESFPRYSHETHGPILDFLSRPKWVTGEGQYNESQKESLRKIPIYPTRDGRCVDLISGAFLPSDYEPPDTGASIAVLSSGKNAAWQTFFRFLDVATLDRYTFISEYLLTRYEALSGSQQLVVLAWLRDHLQQAESEMERDGLDFTDLTDAVKTASLIRCEDGEMRPAGKLYHPNSPLVRDLFGETASFPDMSHYAQGQARWLTFFRDLGMEEKPRARDVVAYIDRLVGLVAEGVPAEIRRSIMTVFEFVDAHWAEMRHEVVEEDGNETFAEALCNRMWLPAECDARRLNRWPGSLVPEDRLYRPDELFLPRQANLVSSQRPIFPMPRENAQLREDLGFPSNVPCALVLEHFDHLLGLWNGSRRQRPAREAYQTSLREVYRYLGVLSQSGSDGDGLPFDDDTVRQRYAGRHCLWHGNRLWQPEHAFSVNVPFFGSRRVGIALETPLREAYQVLGLRKKPSTADYVDYLNELHREFDGKALPQAETDRLVDLYRRFAGELQKAEEPAPHFPLLSRDGKLFPPANIFLGDAPWFEERLDAEKVPLLHRELPTSVVRLAFIRSLARDVIEVPRDHWESVDDPGTVTRIRRLRLTLRSLEFRRGMTRLVRHQHGTCEIDAFDWLGRTSVVAVREILTDLFLEIDDEEILVGSGKANYYFDDEKRFFYLDAGSGKLMRRYVAEMINNTLGDSALYDLSTLSEIVDCDPGEIDQTLTWLRIKPLEEEVEADPLPDDDEEQPAPPGDEMGGTDAGAEEDSTSSGRKDGGPRPDAMPRRGTRGHSSGDERDGESSEVEAESSDETVTPRPARRGSGSGSPVGSKSGERPKSSHQESDDHDGGSAPADSSGTSTRSPEDREPLGATFGKSGDQKDREGTPSSKSQNEKSQKESRGRLKGSTGNAKDRASRGERPIRMRPKQGRRKGSKERKDRMVTYVSGSLPADGQPAQEQMTEEERYRNIELGREAVKRVCAFEESHNRKPVPRGQTHPGYDVDSRNPIVDSASTNASSDRTIEVKGLVGPWTETGVALTPRQFQSARELGDRFWLYVVEFAADPARAVVHPIQNPFGKVNGYWFDRGWKQLADPNEAPSRVGQILVGQRISVANQGEGTVKDILQRGALRVLVIQFDDGREIKRPFNPATMQLRA